MEVAARTDRLRAAMAAQGLDVVLISSLTNVRYLSGFTGSAAVVVVAVDQAVLFTDGRYATQAPEQIAAAGAPLGVEVVAGVEQAGALARLLGSLDPARLGLESEHISWAEALELERRVGQGRALVPTAGLVAALRQDKDQGEVARIERACAIADQALAEVRDLLQESPAEDAFALALDTRMRQLGAEGPSFETIVASGPNAAKPHHRPSGRRIEPGEMVVLDFGALYQGYHSDMTRTLWTGRPSAQMSEVLELVLASQAAGVAATAAGVDTREVDNVCRRVIAEAGYGEYFVHGTGHGVGLDIHESPWLRDAPGTTLAAGQVVTVEPGVYLPGVGGVRIEDTLEVTEHGCRPLTTTPKDRP